MDEKFVHVDAIKEKVKSQPRPAGLNSNELMKSMSKIYGLPSFDCMNIAEHLYLSGYITYPRTESTKYPASFESRSIISSIADYYEIKSFKDIAKNILLNGKCKPSKKGIDNGDHPPITPTNKIPNGLDSRYQNVYNFILFHFLASFDKNAKFLKKTVHFKAGECLLTAKGVQILEEGFTKYYPKSSLSNDLIPNFELKESVKILKADTVEAITSPPKVLSESDLLELMEKYSIGTDASVQVHIKTILKRQYAIMNGTSSIVPSVVGLELCRGYSLIDPTLYKPTVRSEIEKWCKSIEKREMKFEEVLEKSLGIYKEKFSKFKSKFKDVICSGFKEVYHTVKGEDVKEESKIIKDGSLIHLFRKL